MQTLPDRPWLDGRISSSELVRICSRLWACGFNSADMAAFCAVEEAQVWLHMHDIRATARRRHAAA